ncbi:T9SS type A sorting domain-containing protein [Gaetbulibacter sp. M240]|uniref:T9SS type A sorting domain-containing protein n=1 Tax=Gaetbulibacter sp. M240 TaxID=3126511 RepID=UPI00374F8862
MKSIYLAISCALIASLSYSQVFINEFEPNPDGADPTTVPIELKGTPNTAFSGYLLSIECDSDKNIGEVQDAEAVSGNFDSNGLLVVNILDLENPSFTLILVNTFTGSKGSTDIDTNDDGVVDDTSSFNMVYDAIGIPDHSGDEASLYGADLGGTDFKFIGGTSGEPFLVFRDAQSNELFAVQHPGDTEIYTVAGDPIPVSNFNGNPSMATFGSPNAHESTLGLRTTAVSGLKVYPNPASVPLVTVIGTDKSEILVAVYNQIGKLILERSLTSNTLDVSTLQAGLYILKLNQNNHESIQKLIVK